MEENLDSNETENVIDSNETENQKDSKKKLLVGGGIALIAILGFMFLGSKSSSTSEADCQKLYEPVSNAVGMLTSLSNYDSYTQIFVLDARAEQLGNLSSEISGPGAELAKRMSSTLSAVSASFSAGNYTGAPSQEFIDQVKELQGVCPSLFK